MDRQPNRGSGSRAMQTLVVVPTYQEAENVLPLSAQVLALDPTFEVLVVDDSSPDGTANLVAQAGRRQPRLHLIRRAGKLGLGSAYLTAFRFGFKRGFERIATMDCDFSHDPADLPRLVAATEQCELAIGSRYVPGGAILNWPVRRRALSAFGNLYTRVLLRLPVRDCTSGYRCYHRSVLEAVHPFDMKSSGYSFLEEMVWRVHRCGFRIRELPIVFANRRAGSSKIDQREIFLAAWRVLATALRPPRFECRGGPCGRP